jgi:uncharacterized protein YjbI with pentapeptide repeats
MTDYSNQNITGLNLSGLDLTGANFTNTNATNVNFTNAIITNATFKNTLITGATLTGLTFSNLQKGQLLLRAANLSITAINNLTSLTASELRRIQPAISLRSLNAIQSIVVAVPNNAGQGYNVTVTPSVTQVVCIFIATNQNMTITTSGYLVRTLRSNGTVIQDVSNNNTTIPYLKIGTILYKLSIGNGDGVIALCPVDMNIIRVNENSISDLMYHNNEAQKVSLYYSSPTYSASVTFNFTSINLSNKRIFGRVWLDVGVDFDFANIIFNGAGDTTDSQTTEGTYSLTSKSDTDPWVNGSLPLTSYQNRSREFYSFAVSQNMKMLVEFNIYQIFDQTLVDNKKQLVCNGRYTAVAKTSGSAGNFRSSGRFGRISDQGLNLFSIGFSGYNLSATNSIRMAYLDMDVISVPTFTTI